MPHYTPLKFVNQKTTPTKPCSLVPMALKEICPGNEVYASIILGWGWRGAANRNCRGRNRCRQSLEHERKKRKSPCENAKPKCASNFVQWRDWWMLIEMNSINSYYILFYFRKFNWQSRKVEGDAGKHLKLLSFLITSLWIAPRYRLLVTPQGCALAEPGGPWPLTFAFGRLENLRFFIQIICWAP